MGLTIQMMNNLDLEYNGGKYEFVKYRRAGSQRAGCKKTVRGNPPEPSGRFIGWVRKLPSYPLKAASGIFMIASLVSDSALILPMVAGRRHLI